MKTPISQSTAKTNAKKYNDYFNANYQTYKTKTMKIENEYILGIADATLDMWEEMNGTIEAEKEVSFYAEPIINNNKQNTPIGCKLYINYKVNTSEEEDEIQTINIYTKDTIGAVISDISEVLEAIHSSYNFNN